MMIILLDKFFSKMLELIDKKQYIIEKLLENEDIKDSLEKGEGISIRERVINSVTINIINTEATEKYKKYEIKIEEGGLSTTNEYNYLLFDAIQLKYKILLRLEEIGYKSNSKNLFGPYWVVYKQIIRNEIYEYKLNVTKILSEAEEYQFEDQRWPNIVEL